MADATVPSTAPTAPGTRRPAPVGSVILVVVGALLLMMGAGVGLGGGALTLAYATQRDDDGFFTTPDERLETTTYAITSDEIDLGSEQQGGERVADLGDLATVRLQVEGTGEQPVFVGIGPAQDVDRYLADVEHAQIRDIDFDPFRVRYDIRRGGDEPSAPGDETFWAASAEGSGPTTLDWDLESGDWSVVIMNADGSDAVGVQASVGAKVDWLLPLGLILGAGGLFLILVGAVLLVLGAVGLGRAGQWDLAEEPPTPVRLEGHLDPQLSRWLWLVKWLLAIPHFIVLAVLWLAASVVWIVAFFAILFTGRYPRSLFTFTVGVLRWSWRVGFYSFSAFGTDRYPPFTLGPAPDYPARLDVAYPETLSRGLVLVKWWLLAIPQYMVLGILGGGLAVAWGDDGGVGGGLPAGGLIGLLVLFAVIGLLFTGRYAKGLFSLIIGLNRWVYRVLVYVLLLRDEYPPFRLDQGAEEPAPALLEPAETGPAPE